MLYELSVHYESSRSFGSHFVRTVELPPSINAKLAAGRFQDLGLTRGWADLLSLQTTVANVAARFLGRKRLSQRRRNIPTILKN